MQPEKVRARAPAGKSPADLLVVAARYQGAGRERRLQFAHVYEKHFVVWSDVKLYDRARLVEALRSGLKVMTARPAELQGDFELGVPVRLTPDGERLVAEGRPGDQGDDLGVPLI